MSRSAVADRLHRLSLRTRLLAILLGLLLVSGTALTLFTSLALRRFLTERLDQQLAAAGNRYSLSLEHPNTNDKDADNSFDSVVGQQTGTLGARIVDGSVTAVGIVGRGSGSGVVSGDDLQQLARLTVGGPHDIHLPQLGEYRVLVQAGQDRDLLVTALPKRGVDDTIARLAAIEITVFAGAMVLSALAGTVAVRLSLRPLQRVARTARRVADLSLGSGQVMLPQPLPNAAPQTEVGQVTEAFNQMVAHVQAAFGERQASEDRLRQFVADASHELRTPVAVIRSHTEYAQVAGGQLPAEVEQALRRIAGESDRMGKLVEDLLLLARLDSGRPLAADEVDLTRLALDAAIDTRAVGADHHWHLELPEEPVTITGDQHRLHQVLANLLSNARTHTPAGTTVTIALRLIAGSDDAPAWAELVVSDDGPGIDPKVLPHVFERFARGDSARSHSSGESGLGLSIVDAIVRAHRGTITADSRPGRTAFTIRLPVEPTRSPARAGAVH